MSFRPLRPLRLSLPAVVLWLGASAASFGAGGAMERAIEESPAQLQSANRMASVLAGEKLLLEADALNGQAKIDFLEKAARSGDAAAALRLGEMLDHGAGLARDLPRAIGYYRAAALGGSMEGAHNLGAAYASGRGIARDYIEAFTWLAVARERGDVSGGDELVRARVIKRGLLEPLRLATARVPKLAKRAPVAEVIAALPEPAPLESVLDASEPETVDMADFGSGKDSSPPEAKPDVVVMTLTGQRLTWPKLVDLERAADRGEPAALGALGRLLVAGRLVPADPLRGVILLERSAGRGDADAAHQLADLYSEGRHVARDDPKAFSYYLQAAKGRSLLAMANVGIYYTNGRGTPRDLVQGLTWLIVAKHYGLDRGQEKNLRGHLSSRQPEQVKQAEDAAAVLIREFDAAAR